MTLKVMLDGEHSCSTEYVEYDPRRIQAAAAHAFGTGVRVAAGVGYSRIIDLPKCGARERDGVAVAGHEIGARRWV